jgi:5-formyltetrahydrofolate cyclo-ligase
MQPPHDGSRLAGTTAAALARAKAVLRREAVAARDRLPVEKQQAWSADIRDRLLGLACWKEARAVGLYATIRGEVDAIPLVEAARAAGKSIAFPRAQRSEGTLAFYEVASAGDLAPGAFGVPEPAGADIRLVPIGRLSLLIVPALAFDLRGQRLGFGGGYYDRLLSKHRRPSVGLAYECQIHDDLPVGARDQGVDIVVTETRWFAAQENHQGGGRGIA